MSDQATCGRYGSCLRWGMILTVVACLSGCGRGENSKVSSQNSASPNEPPIAGAMTEPTGADEPASCGSWPIPDANSAPIHSCTVSELEALYRANWIETDTRYSGKLLEIQGTVLDGSKNLGGDPIVWLRGMNAPFNVCCILRSVGESEKLPETGQACHIRGIYSASLVPIFVHCTVVGAPLDATSTPSEVIKSSRRQPEVILTAEQLQSEVTADSAKATRQYAGKVMQVTGPLARISHVALGEMKYHLGKPLGIQYFLRGGSRWCCVMPGQTITILGEGSSTYPCLVNCEVVHVTGAPEPIHQAKSLGESLETNRDAFRKQYYLKQLVVTGEVSKVEFPKEIGDDVVITLRSTATTSIDFEMEAAEAITVESVRIGETVTITGWNTKESPTDSIKLVQGLFWRDQ